MNETFKKITETDSPIDDEANSATPVEKSLDEKISDLIGPFFHEHQVEQAIVIAKDPKTDKAAIFYRGHFYDITTLLSDVYAKFKSKIANELI